MIRRNAVPLCHCGELDTGVEHWSRCIVCHPEQYLGMVRSDRMVGWCELHRRTGAQCIAVAIYAGIVALGEWARALRGRYKLEQEIEDAQDLTGDFKCLRRTDKPDPKFRLRQARKAAGKTMGDLARHLGTSVVFVSDCEVGRATMPFDQLVETAHFLAVPLEAIQ